MSLSSDPPDPAAAPAEALNSAAVYAALRREILELVLAPGEVLEELEISRRYGVSRSPVREAIIRLTAEGLARRQRNRGATVSRFDIESLPPYFEAQTLLFRLTARLAAERGSPVAVTGLEAIQTQLEQAISARDPFGVIENNRAFHLEIARIAANEWYQRWLHQLLDQGQRIMRLYVRMHAGDLVPLERLDWHRALIAAIRQGDVEAADEAGREDARIVPETLSGLIQRDRSLTMGLAPRG